MRTFFLTSAIFLSGCVAFGGKEPLKTIHYASPEGRGTTLIVLLPGILDDSRTFAQEDFIAVARRHGVDAAFVAADTDIDYFMAETVVQRLHTDVITPARAAGYRDIWMVGVSLGGLGALLYLREHPGSVQGVVLLSPYLGRAGTVASIAESGSLAAWQPPESCDRHRFCSLWRWLQDFTRTGFQQPDRASVVLGYGNQDQYPQAHGLLAQALGPERTLRVDGGHDWNTWRALWQRYLSEHWNRSLTEKR